MTRVLLIVGHDSAIRQFRKTTIRAMRDRGFEVKVLVTGEAGDGRMISEALGASYAALGISHQTKNPVHNLRLIFKIRQQLHAFRPTAVLVRNAQAIAYLRWARFASRLRFKAVAMVEGLGSAKRKIVQTLWKFGFPIFDVVVLLNPDDAEDLTKLGVFSRNNRIVQTDGIGIELDQFKACDLPMPGDINTLWRIAMIARLVEEKGVLVALEAVKILREDRGFPIELDLIGGYTDSSPVVLKERLEQTVKTGLVNFHGLQSDVKPFLETCHLHVLPSWYREGLPVTVMEAAAIGRASIVTDARAIRHAVNDESGWHVSARDPVALADCIEKALMSGEYISRGKAAQLSASSRFDRNKFDDQICDLLR